MGEATAERLNRLERTNRRLMAALGLCGLPALIALGIGAARDGTRPPDDDQIILRDRRGTVRVRLSADESGPSLSFLDGAAIERFRIQTLDDGTSLVKLATPQNPGTRRTVGLRMMQDGWSTLSFLDAGDQERLSLGLGYDGEPRLTMYTKDGKARVSLGSDMSGRVDCVLHDASGNERAVIRSAPGGAASFAVYDSKGERLFEAP